MVDFWLYRRSILLIPLLGILFYSFASIKYDKSSNSPIIWVVSLFGFILLWLLYARMYRLANNLKNGNWYKLNPPQDNWKRKTLKVVLPVVYLAISFCAIGLGSKTPIWIFGYFILIYILDSFYPLFDYRVLLTHKGIFYDKSLRRTSFMKYHEIEKLVLMKTNIALISFEGEIIIELETEQEFQDLIEFLQDKVPQMEVITE